MLACHPYLRYTLFLQAAGATTAKVVYPEDEEVLKRTVLVGNLSPLVNLEQVRPYLRTLPLVLPVLVIRNSSLSIRQEEGASLDLIVRVGLNI
jgi:hypothetical protein